MKKVKASIKLVAFVVAVLTYFIVTLPLYPFLKFAPHYSRLVINRIVSFYCKIGLYIFAIQVDFKEERQNIAEKTNYLFVSNHLSYLDILVISSLYPSSFITSVEIKETPFLGQLCQLAGCLFVERRDKRNLRGEIGEISSALTDGLNVVIFPEATSTNGEELRRFRRPLFRAAIDSQTDLQTLTLNPISINGRPVEIGNRDFYCWYGKMSFFPHLWSLCQQDRLEVEVVEAGLLRVAKYSETADIADEAFCQVERSWRPIT